jgi:hypothetical protein
MRLRVIAIISRLMERWLRSHGYSIVPFTAGVVMIRNGTSLYELDLSKPVGHKIVQVTGGVYEREDSSTARTS